MTAPCPAGAGAAPSGDARLARVVLEGEALTRLSPLQEADRAQAVEDLAAENHFAPLTAKQRPTHGPYVLHLSIQEGRLVLDIRRADDTPLAVVALALGPFRGLIKDYQILVESHLQAVHEGREARIQAIDMGRRGLHNEGAALLRERLAGKVAIDFDTARRLFTLVCVLHQRI
ncbi:MAG TPA: UPF0262 family protein [Acetobacteraceae bacterium]|jgi:uncharacterized protein (UPF0262 family)|nr:UPF0262 family protein [Acetobacteraceae bacterium]